MHLMLNKVYLLAFPHVKDCMMAPEIAPKHLKKDFRKVGVFSVEENLLLMAPFVYHLQ